MTRCTFIVEAERTLQAHTLAVKTVVDSLQKRSEQLDNSWVQSVLMIMPLLYHVICH